MIWGYQVRKDDLEMAFYCGCICDKCRTALTYEGVFPKYFLTDRARESGWTVGKRVLCPKCKNRIRIRRKKLR